MLGVTPRTIWGHPQGFILGYFQEVMFKRPQEVGRGRPQNVGW